MIKVYKPSTEELDGLKAEAMANGTVSPEEWREKMARNIFNILSKEPLQYRSYGPYWWLVKKELNEQGFIVFGDTIDAEWYENMDYGDPVYNMLAAWLYADWAIDNGLVFSTYHTVTQIVNDEGEVDSIDYALIDDEVEIMATWMPR